MSKTEFADDEEITIGLSAAEIKEVARRQLVASVAVAVVIAIGVGAAFLMPGSGSQDYAQATSHKVATVQQPTFVVPQTAHVEPAKKHDVEVP
jgi:hypothetical protein